MSWNKVNSISSKKYKCGYCGNVVASSQGYFAGQGSPVIYLCPHCQNPTYFRTPDSQIPGVAPGNDVDDLPNDVEALYRESRGCVAASAYTSAVLTCRKLLMNIAVAQGADPGQGFVSYVDYLANAGYVPPNGRGWVDHIRRKGNEANHEIVLMSQEDANDLISFAEMLLKFIYEFPAKVPSPSQQASS